jgi:hypothetical protein
VREEAIRQYGEDPPPTVVLTHPAGWGARRRELFQRAAAEAGMPDAKLMSEPEAAAMYLAAERAAGSPIGHGERVAVYDLGGGTFDACLLRRTGAGFEIVGEPGGDPRIGGEVFDSRLYRQLGQAGLDPDDWTQLQASDDPSWMRANWEFRRGVREAKEAVSRDATSPVYVPQPVGRELQVTRAQVEDLVRDDITATLDVLEATTEQGDDGAGSLSAVYLVGGSSRMPVVASMVRERFGRADTKGDPKHVVALGAARAGAAPVEVSGPVPGQAQSAVATAPRRRRKRPVVASVLTALALVVVVAGAVLAPNPPKPVVDPPIDGPGRTTSVSPTANTTPSQSTGSGTAVDKSTPSRSTVSGTAVDKSTGQPMQGVEIAFYKQPESQDYMRLTKTDANGRYSLDLPAGDWRAYAGVTADPYVTFEIVGGGSETITVPDTTTVDFALWRIQ